MKRAWLAAMVSFGLAASACTPKADATCEAAMRGWLAAMEASENDARQLKEAYAFLGERTRRTLTARAAQKSARLGRRIQPHELFAEGRTVRAFEVHRVEEKVALGIPKLHITGQAAGEDATVTCSLEGGGARIELELPEPPSENSPR